MNPQELVPKNKDDLSCTAALRSASVQDVAPILPQLLGFLQNRNWPVATAMMEVLPRFHRQLVPAVRDVLNSKDDIWKYWVLDLVQQFPAESAAMLRPELERIARYPTTSEMYEEVDEKARFVLENIERVEEEIGRLGYGAEVSGEVYSYITTFRVLRGGGGPIRCQPDDLANTFLIYAPQDLSEDAVQQYIHQQVQNMQRCLLEQESRGTE